MFPWKFWKSNAKQGSRRMNKRSARAVGRFESLEPRQMMTTSGDFNGDGIQDIAIGTPGKDIGRFIDAGQVSVIYGRATTGLATRGNQLWDLNRPGIFGNVRSFDLFGSALATGDFNFDGFDDLAIGAPGKDVDGLRGAGTVTILYGSINGLQALGNQLWTADDIPVGDGIQEFAGFGSALTTGDFNGDLFDDIAIGSPFQTRGSVRDIGATYVLYGAPFIGIDDVDAQIWSQRTTGLNVKAQRNSEFGAALTTGDFNGDGFDDLAIGSPKYRPRGLTNVIYGTSTVLSAVGNQKFLYGGTALATGDFDGDQFDDLAIGAASDVRLPGTVSILYGFEFGLPPRFREIITLDTVGGTSQRNDSFGFSLATGNFDGDRYDDLAIGAPLATANDVAGAGLVVVMYGSVIGLTTDGLQQFDQGPGIDDTSEADDLFGFSLAVGDYNGDGFFDLAIGVPGEDIDNWVDAGIVQVIYGSEDGLDDTVEQLWRLGLPGLLGHASSYDTFGWAIA